MDGLRPASKSTWAADSACLKLTAAGRRNEYGDLQLARLTAKLPRHQRLVFVMGRGFASPPFWRFFDGETSREEALEHLRAAGRPHAPQRQRHVHLPHRFVAPAGSRRGHD